MPKPKRPPRIDKRQVLLDSMVEEIVAWNPGHPAAKAALEFKVFTVFKCSRRTPGKTREIDHVTEVLHRVPKAQLGILRNYLIAKTKKARWSYGKFDRALKLVQKAIDTYPEPKPAPVKKEDPPHSDKSGEKMKSEPKPTRSRKAPPKRSKPVKRKAAPKKAGPKKKK